MPWPREPLIGLIAALLAGCQLSPSANESPQPLVAPHPYLVGLALPVLPEPEEPETTAATDGESLYRVLSMNPETIARDVKEALEEENVYSGVEILDLPGSAAGARESARATGADLLVEIRALRPPVYRFSHRNGWFVPNTVLWFVLGLPSWWIRDRVYEVEWDIGFTIHFLLAHREAISFPPRRLRETVALNVAEQGVSWRALVTPPGFYEGPDIADELTLVLEDLLIGEVVEGLKNQTVQGDGVEISLEEIAGGEETTGDGRRHVEVLIRSRQPLERVVARAGGVDLLVRSAFFNMPAPETVERTGESLYSFVVPIPAAAGEHLIQILARQNAPGAVLEFPFRDEDSVWSATRTFRVQIPGS